MADFRDDILKEEEQYGGFTPGEPDDDTFLLQDKSISENAFHNPIQKNVSIEEENHSIVGVANDKSKQNSNKFIENKEKSNRKNFAVIPIIAAVALLLITAAALLFLIPEKPYGLFSIKSESEDSLNLMTDKQTIDSLADSKELSQNDEIEWNDSLSQILTHSEIISIDTVRSLSEFTENSVHNQLIEQFDTETNMKDSPDITKQNSGKEIEQKSSPKSAESNVTEQPRKIVAKQTVKPNTVSNVKPKDKAATAKDNDRTKNTNDIAEMKPDKNLDSDILRDKALSETYVPKDVPGIYIVQIYSSPSREDAQAWLDKLKSKNVPEAFISEQNVRDKTWYRVRFGKYITREEARSAALRYGFAQTWIDRVK